MSYYQVSIPFPVVSSKRYYGDAAWRMHDLCHNLTGSCLNPGSGDSNFRGIEKTHLYLIAFRPFGLRTYHSLLRHWSLKPSPRWHSTNLLRLLSALQPDTMTRHQIDVKTALPMASWSGLVSPFRKDSEPNKTKAEFKLQGRVFQLQGALYGLSSFGLEYANRKDVKRTKLSFSAMLMHAWFYGHRIKDSLFQSLGPIRMCLSHMEFLVHSLWA